MSAYSVKTNLLVRALQAPGLTPGVVHNRFRWITDLRVLERECLSTDLDGKKRLRFAMVYKASETVPSGGEVANKTGGTYDKWIGDVFAVRFHLALADEENTEAMLNEATEAVKDYFDTAECRAMFAAQRMTTSSLRGQTYGHVSYAGTLMNFIEMRITVFHQRQTGA